MNFFLQENISDSMFLDFFRVIALIQLTVLFVGLLRASLEKRTKRVILWFVLSIGGATIHTIFAQYPILQFLLAFGSSLSTALLPLLAFYLFSEKRIITNKLRLFFLIHPGVSYLWLVWFLRAGNPTLAVLPPLLFGFIFAAIAIWIAASEFSSDLLDERRALRLRFSILVILGIIVQMVFRALDPAGEGISALAEPSLVTFISIYIQIVAFPLHPGIFPEAKDETRGVHREDFQETNSDQVLLKALEQKMTVESLFKQEGLTIGKLASILNVKEYRLRQQIRLLGYSRFSDYLCEKRLEEACRLLGDPQLKDMAIVRIALDSGFSSAAAFNRSFREKQGITPGEFRKLAQKDSQF